MANKAKLKPAHGSRKNVEAAIAEGKLDSYDLLFLEGDNETPAIGWVNPNGEAIIIEKTDVSALESDISQVEKELANKANAEEVNDKISEIETTLSDVAKAAYAHEQIKYEFTGVPTGTLVDYRENEIRVMCPANSVWNKQNVGVGGDSNTFYGTFKTYVYDENIIGYKEHLGSQSDLEILYDLKEDQYGRRYQPTWLGLAKYDESTGVWTYNGANSTKEKMIGWDYRIDWFDANGVMVASDSIRINLSNEDCHSVNEPYYVGKMMKEVDTKIEEKLSSVESAWEIVEF